MRRETPLYKSKRSSKSKQKKAALGAIAIAAGIYAHSGEQAEARNTNKITQTETQNQTAQDSQPQQAEITIEVPESQFQRPELSIKTLEHYKQTIEHYKKLTDQEAKQAQDALTSEFQQFYMRQNQGTVPGYPILMALNLTESSKDTQEVVKRKRSLRARAADLLGSLTPDQARNLQTLIGDTVHKLSADPTKTWRTKTKKLSETNRRFGEYITDHIEQSETNCTFTQWYNYQLSLNEQFQANADDFFIYADTHYKTKALTSKKDWQTLRKEHQQAVKQYTKYMTPEATLAAMSAEIYTHMSPQGFAESVPALFNTYNLYAIPSQNDKKLSAGPTQLTKHTLGSLTAKYKKRLQKMQETGAFKDITIPESEAGRLDTKTTAEAIVLDWKSAAFWSHLQIMFSGNKAFSNLMQNEDFAQAWRKSKDESKLIFLSTLTAITINGGRMNGITVADKTIREIESQDLNKITDKLQRNTYTPLTKRGAYKARETARAIAGLTK